MIKYTKWSGAGLCAGERIVFQTASQLIRQERQRKKNEIATAATELLLLLELTGFFARSPQGTGAVYVQGLTHHTRPQ